VLPPLAVLVALPMAEAVLSYAYGMPVCPFYDLLGYYCPSCGNTRSLAALLRGQIGQALRFNITLPFLALLGLSFYAENALRLLGKDTKIVPRSDKFIYVCLIVFFMYYLVRNFIPYLTP
jgi:hypothetical protein